MVQQRAAARIDVLRRLRSRIVIPAMTRIVVSGDAVPFFGHLSRIPTTARATVRPPQRMLPFTGERRDLMRPEPG